MCLAPLHAIVGIDEGLEAARKGDYPTALMEFSPLAVTARDRVEDVGFFDAPVHAGLTLPDLDGLLRGERPRQPIANGSPISPNLWTAEGWRYVAAVVDLFSRRVVGWSMQAIMNATGHRCPCDSDLAARQA